MIRSGKRPKKFFRTRAKSCFPDTGQKTFLVLAWPPSGLSIYLDRFSGLGGPSCALLRQAQGLWFAPAAALASGTPQAMGVGPLARSGAKIATTTQTKAPPIGQAGL